MIKDSDTKLVGPYEFIHGFNDQFEYYSHMDAQGRNWQTWRHRKGPINTKTWFASVTAPGRNGGTKMLNTAIVDSEGEVIQADPLYYLNPYSPQALLKGLVPLIEANEWPKEEPCPKN